MSLDQTKIVSNTKKYFETATKFGFMNDELTKFLGNDFIKSPATNMVDNYNAFEGGLIDHLLRVASYAVKVNSSLPEEERISQDSLLKVCLLHGIGKAKLFVPCTSEWHRKNQGKMYEFVDDLTPMRISERSIYYAVSHGISFSEEEYQAILFFDKTDDKMSEFHNSTLGELLKFASKLAIKHSQKNLKNGTN